MKLKGLLQHTNTFLKVCTFLLILLVSSLLAIGLWGWIGGGNQSIESLKWLQLLQTIGVFLIPCFLCAYLWSNYPLRYLSLTTFPSAKTALSTIGLILIALPAINLLGAWNQTFTLPDSLAALETLMRQQEEAAALLTERFLIADNIGILLINLTLMALLPAISEELCFRAIVIKLFSGTKSNNQPLTAHLAIWASAIIFSFIHFQFYGFIPRMLMGAFFGYLLLWTGSLWVPILAHFTNNAMAVLFSYISQHTPLSSASIDTFGTNQTLWVGILSSVLFLITLFLFRRYITPSALKE